MRKIPFRRAFRKIAAGDAYRKTRLHDEKGNFVGLRQLTKLPRNTRYVAARKLTGRLPHLPWFTFNALERIERIVSPTWSMVEFGSGMSTAWFAERVGRLHSIEHDPEWFETVRSRLEELGLASIRYELRPLDRYDDLSDYADGSLDFAVVDGVLRAQCVTTVLPKVCPGGYVYLDNSDKDMTTSDGDLRLAEARLLAAVEERGGSVEYFTGLTVGLLNSHQGLLARLG